MGKSYKDIGSLYVRARGGAIQNPIRPDSCAPARPAYMNAGQNYAGPARSDQFLLVSLFPNLLKYSIKVN